MKYKLTALAIAMTFFLGGCGESENKAPRQKEPQASRTEDQSPTASKQEPSTLSNSQSTPAKVATAPGNTPDATQDKLAEEAKSLAEALAYDQDATPQEQVEKDIKEVLEAVMADLPAEEK